VCEPSFKLRPDLNLKRFSPPPLGAGVSRDELNGGGGLPQNPPLQTGSLLCESARGSWLARGPIRRLSSQGRSEGSAQRTGVGFPFVGFHRTRVPYHALYCWLRGEALPKFSRPPFQWPANSHPKSPKRNTKTQGQAPTHSGQAPGRGQATAASTNKISRRLVST
jgi:hypothetical protein